MITIMESKSENFKKEEFLMKVVCTN